MLDGPLVELTEHGPCVAGHCKAEVTAVNQVTASGAQESSTDYHTYDSPALWLWANRVICLSLDFLMAK